MGTESQEIKMNELDIFHKGKTDVDRVLVDGELVATGKMNNGGTWRDLSTKEKKESALLEAERIAWGKKCYADDEGYLKVERYYKGVGVLLHNPLTGYKDFFPFNHEFYDELKEITQEQAMALAKEYLFPE